MSYEDAQKERETKTTNGEILGLTKEEFDRVVDVFKTLRKWDDELLITAVNGMQIKLKRPTENSLKNYVGKHIFIALRVREEIQSQEWDHYYKLEKVMLTSWSEKADRLKVHGRNGKLFEIEPRGVFVEV